MVILITIHHRATLCAGCNQLGINRVHAIEASQSREPAREKTMGVGRLFFLASLEVWSGTEGAGFAIQTSRLPDDIGLEIKHGVFSIVFEDQHNLISSSIRSMLIYDFIKATKLLFK